MVQPADALACNCERTMFGAPSSVFHGEGGMGRQAMSNMSI